MNNDNESYELEEMRQQIALLKGKLEKQTIVNEQLINKTMNNNVDWMKKRMSVLTSLTVISLIYCPFAFYYFMGASVALTIWIEVVLLISAGLHWYANSLFPKKSELSQNLINNDLRIQRFLKFNIQKFIIGMTLVIIAIVWMVADFADRADFILRMISVAIGGSIGLFVAIRYFFIEIRKRSNLIRENIREIQELRGE